MSLGIRTSRFRRVFPAQQTTIDGLPVILKAGTVKYVDGAVSASGSGLTFDSAYKTIQEAVTACLLEDTVFIRPLAPGAYYTESVIVPNTARGITIIGTGNGKGGSVYQACTWRNSSNSVDDSACDLRPPHASIENIHFFSRAAQSSGFGVRAYWNTGSGLAIGSALYNCGFSGDLADHPAGAGVVQSAVRFDSNEGMRVEECIFVDCRVGIASGSTMNAYKELWIENNRFNGLAANIAADFFLSDGTNVSIIGNHFGHTQPSHAAGTMQEYIFQIGGTTITGSVSGNYFGMTSTAKADTGNTSSLIFGGNFSAGGPLAT